ncbi:MAG: DUF1456 family protein [Ghiorsea sp.]
MINNVVFKKVTIANGLKQFEIKEIFELGGLELSSSAIKALSAGAKNKNYTKMTDDQLESFMNGLIVYWRGDVDEPNMVPQGLENMVMNSNHDVLLELESLVAEAQIALKEEALKGGNSNEATLEEDALEEEKELKTSVWKEKSQEDEAS